MLPPVVVEALVNGLPQMDKRWGGRFLRDAVLAGPESRGSSPVRIDRDNVTRESPGVPGFYPVGEGAGYAGGIVSAAVDGLRTARAVIARFAAIDAGRSSGEGGLRRRRSAVSSSRRRPAAPPHSAGVNSSATTRRPPRSPSWCPMKRAALSGVVFLLIAGAAVYSRQQPPGGVAPDDRPAS